MQRRYGWIIWLGCLIACGLGAEAPVTATRLDALSALEKVRPFSSTVRNDDSFPRTFAQVNGFALFFSGYFKGLFRTDGTPEGTWLVRDLGPQLDTYQRVPNMAVLGTRAYWMQEGALWVSDGTPTGTTVLKRFGASTFPLTPPMLFNGALYFGVDKDLYTSDGTEAGTRLLAAVQVFAGEDGFHQAWRVVGNRLYFVCGLPAATTGSELCVSDGTASGTRLVTDIVPGSVGSSPLVLGELNGTLIFSAQLSSDRRTAYATDGTGPGTVRLLPPLTNGDVVSRFEEDFAVLGGAAFFPCYTSTTGSELCRTDGTPAGTTVLDFNPGTAHGAIGPLAVLGDSLLFKGIRSATGHELWKTDGTVAGTAMVKELYPGSFNGLGLTKFVTLGTSVYFAGYTQQTGTELWKTDGTEAGTVQVREILPAGKPERYPLNLSTALVVDGKILFAADDGTHGLEPWVSDGTTAGTRLLSDLSADETVGQSSGLRFYDGWLMMAATEDDSRYNLWRSDGTPGGTGRLVDFGQSYGFGFSPLGSSLLFFAQRTGDPAKLWKTDGTAAGTVAVSDLGASGPVQEGTGPYLFFTGSTPASTVGLWQTDGTTAGTHLTSPWVENARRLGMSNGRVYLTGLYGALGNELWRSDGTPGSTVAVKDIRVGSGSSEPRGFTALGNLTLFSADDGVTGFELWSTDGTTAGTVRVADLRPGSSGSSPGSLFAWKDGVLFWGSTASNNVDAELWKTDGTTAGTVRIKAVNLYGFEQFVAWGDFVFFTATDATGTELWRTDGTAAGTLPVADLYPGALSSRPTGITLVSPDGPLAFVAEEPSNGRELWLLDSPTGTPTLAANIAPGPRSSFPSMLTATGPTLYFEANDGSGRALFKLSGLNPDTTPPRLTCPADVVAQSSGQSGAVVTYPPALVRDDSGSAPSVSASPASGTLFPMGATTVTVSATDASGNRGECSFTVTVAAPPPPPVVDAGTPDGGTVADGGARSDGGTVADGGMVADGGARPDGGAAAADAGVTEDAGTDAGAAGRDGGADAGLPGTGGGSDAGPRDPVSEETGCGCGSTGPSLAFWGLAGLALLAPRRRRSGHPHR